MKFQCLPAERVWPEQRCLRCEKSGQPCGPNVSLQGFKKEQEASERKPEWKLGWSIEDGEELSNLTSRPPHDNEALDRKSPDVSADGERGINVKPPRAASPRYFDSSNRSTEKCARCRLMRLKVCLSRLRSMHSL
jgi:hypothetical protein